MGWDDLLDIAKVVVPAGLKYLQSRDALEAERRSGRRGGNGWATPSPLGGGVIVNGYPYRHPPTVPPWWQAENGGNGMMAPYIQASALVPSGVGGAVAALPPAVLAILRALGLITAGGVLAEGATEVIRAIGGGGGGGAASAVIDCPQVFYQSPNGGTRARRTFSTINPTTGGQVWYRSAGRPVLFSGDFGACKRVNRVASRARRRMGRRRPR